MFHPNKRVIWFLIAAYAAPLAIYALTFGPVLSSDHQRWAEFGSAMSGIYAPIIAATTLAVLLAQVGLQKQINDHEYDQAHIAQARADIEFYAVQLAEKLDQVTLPSQSFRAVLHANFQPRNVAELDSDSLRVLAANIDSLLPGVMAMWFGVYPILEGLSAGIAAGRSKSFDMTLGSSLQKLIALLSYETCVSLENYHRVRTEGKLNVTYRFSSLLEKNHAANQAPDRTGSN